MVPAQKSSGKVIVRESSNSKFPICHCKFLISNLRCQAHKKSCCPRDVPPATARFSSRSRKTLGKTQGDSGYARIALGDSGRVRRWPETPGDSGVRPGKTLRDSGNARRLRESPALTRRLLETPGCGQERLSETRERPETPGESGLPRRLQESPGHGLPRKTLRDSGTPRDSKDVGEPPDVPRDSGSRATQKDSQRLGNAPRLLGRPGCPETRELFF